MNAAIERFQKLLEQNPKNHLARFSLAKALFDAGQFSEARSHFEASVREKPDWMVAQILLGKCAAAMGDSVSAKSAYQRGLQLAIEQNHEGPQAELEALLRD